MKERLVYLDSSAIVKRYVEETGSDHVRSLYKSAYGGVSKLAFSSWNIGEVLGVFDRARVKELISEKEYTEVKTYLLTETWRLSKLGQLIIVPVRLSILRNSWKFVGKHHIYQADAIQIASAKAVNASEFLVADKKLHRVAIDEGLNSSYVG